jgi:hypothetical protein
LPSRLIGFEITHSSYYEEYGRLEGDAVYIGSAVCCLCFSAWLLGFQFLPENGTSPFLRNVGEFHWAAWRHFQQGITIPNLLISL